MAIVEVVKCDYCGKFAEDSKCCEPPASRYYEVKRLYESRDDAVHFCSAGCLPKWAVTQMAEPATDDRLDTLAELLENMRDIIRDGFALADKSWIDKINNTLVAVGWRKDPAT